ncbi:uncharacterized protein LOC107749804 isoform X1 [Sinocyclocheilus rhinocerous]|nr:PREDICTED: uncharacterized protein LOC107749804 isoform X1 [Sinocyclocheilus rhinocerous]
MQLVSVLSISRRIRSCSAAVSALAIFHNLATTVYAHDALLRTQRPPERERKRERGKILELLLPCSVSCTVCELEVNCSCAATPHNTGACQDSSRNPNRASESKHPDTQITRKTVRRTPTDSRNRLIMAQMFSISDNESDTETSEDCEDSDLTKNNSGSQQKTNHDLAVPDRLKGEQLGRHRNLSMNDEDLLETGAADEGDLVGGDPFRPRSRSAPPALWAAKKYGRQLRRMSDEFDILLDKGMKRVKSAGTTRQMQQSPSWFAFLWSHKESDAESRPAE